MARPKKEKLIIYQVLMRLFGNANTTRKKDGTIEENGCGKMSDFNVSALNTIKQLGQSILSYWLAWESSRQQASLPDVAAIQIRQLWKIHF